MTYISRICHSALETVGFKFKSTSSVGIFFLFPVLNVSQWTLRIKSVTLNNILLCFYEALKPNGTNSSLLLFKVLRGARVVVSAPCL